MSEEHISFEKLSDLCEGEIETSEEQERLLKHIEVCSICKKEYDKIMATFRLIRGYKSVELDLSHVKKATMNQINKIARKRRLLKMAPLAAAASFVVIISSVLVFNGNSNSVNYAQNELKTSVQDNTSVYEAIQKNGASIVTVTDMYVEGEISSNDFMKLRRDLGFKKVTYSRVMKNSSRFDDGNLEVASVGSFPDSPSSSAEVIRFRVYK